MSFALSVILKTTIILASASLMTLGLRRASASARHAVWAIAMFSALVLPFASTLLPSVEVQVLPESMASQPISEFGFGISDFGDSQIRNPNSEFRNRMSLQANSPKSLVPPERPSSAWPWQQWIVYIWVFGSAVVLARLLLGSFAVWRLARNSVRVSGSDWNEILGDLRESLSVSKRVLLRISDRTIPPMTWGIFRHVILLPERATDWTHERRRLVLAHELAHVKRNDGIIQILMQAICSLYWFNPLAWYAARRLRIERECACDDQVLSLGADADDYADHLLQVARTINPGNGLSLATVAMAHRSQLETRLLSILDTRTRRQNMSPIASASLLAGVAALTLSIACLEITAKPPTIAFLADATAPPLEPVPFFDFMNALNSMSPPPDVVQGAVKELGTETPIQGALLTFTPVVTQPGSDSEPLYNVETRTDGTFTLPDLPPGQYRVTLVHDGFVRIHSEAEPALLTIGGDARPADLQLQMMRGPAISGRVFDEEGNLKNSVQVELMRMEYRDGKQTLTPSDLAMATDSRGEYRLFGLEPGEYYLRARARAGTPEFVPVYYPGVTDSLYAMPIAVRAGADISGIDLSITKDNLHSVRLKVDVAAPAPQNPELSFYVNPRSRTGGAAGGAGMQFHTSGSNIYVSPLLAPGSYEIEIYLRDPDPIRWARTTVDIVDSDVDAGTVVIGPGVWIQGRIAANEALPVNVRRGQLQVILRPLDGPVFLLPSAQVSDDGTFLIPRVPERKFRIDLAGLPPEVYFASARYSGREVQENSITVTSGSQGPLDLFIARSGGVVAGVVRNTKDQPVSNGQVVLIPSNRDNPNLFRTAAVDQFGVFSIPGVPPGEYGVVAWQGPQTRAFLDPAFLKAVENQVTKVIVQRGFTNNINVRAIPAN